MLGNVSCASLSATVSLFPILDLIIFYWFLLTLFQHSLYTFLLEWVYLKPLLSKAWIQPYTAVNGCLSVKLMIIIVEL